MTTAVIARPYSFKASFTLMHPNATNDENLNTGLSCLFAATSYQLMTPFECKSKCNMATGGALKGKTIAANTHFGLIQHTWTACSSEFCSYDTSISEILSPLSTAIS